VIAAALQATAAPLAQREVWPNGLRLLVAERPSIPIVTLLVYVRAGAAFDPADRPGLANLTAELLTRGTQKRTGNEIEEAIEFVGGSLEADASRDGVTVSLSVLKKDLGLGLDLLADVLLNPIFPPDELQRKVRELQGVIRRQEQDPESVASRAMAPLLFPGHPYGHPVVGTADSLKTIHRDEVEAFYRGHYRPDGTVIAVVGDVKLDEIRQELRRRLGGWAKPSSSLALPREAPLNTPTKADSIQRDLTQTTMILGRPAIRRNHPDYYVLQVASYILGGGSASRLYHHLREQKGLVYFVGSYLTPGKYGGSFIVNLQTRNEGVQEALSAVRQELTRLSREPVTGEELALAKAYLTGSFPLRMDTNRKVAGLLLTIEEEQLGLDYPETFKKRIESVTAADVQRAARQYLDPATMSLVVVGDLKKSGFSPEKPSP
jgi:zinc protease